MYGKRFVPRIRGLQKQAIFRIDTEKDYGPIKVLLEKKTEPCIQNGSLPNGIGWDISMLHWKADTPQLLQHSNGKWFSQEKTISTASTVNLAD